MTKLTEEQLKKTEECIKTLAEILDVEEQDVLEVLELGMDYQCANSLEGKMKPRYAHFIDEMQEIFKL